MNIYEEQRPWGSFRRFSENENTTVKLLIVGAGQAFSLQKHSQREEFWRVLSGHPRVTVGDDTHMAKPGDEFFVEQGQLHRIDGGANGAEILEIAFGAFNENDIERIEDKYGRAQ